MKDLSYHYGVAAMQFANYQTEGFHDEMFDDSGMPREEARLLVDTIASLDDGQFLRCQRSAERLLLQLGITFNVYGDSAGTERIFPFDLIPRIVTAREWDWIERGLKQRIHALNLFIDDIYHDQKILKDKIIPEEVIKSAIFYRPQCIGINPPRGVWCHITGTDLVRHGDGQIYVLEDNLRVPSGVSYVLENRDLMKRTFPQVFEGLRVRPVDDYPSRLLEMLESIGPRGAEENPTVVLLTPGIYNSAYFEHSFLAQKMGVQLVEGSDLIVQDRQGLDAHHQGPAQGRRDLPPHRRRFSRPNRLPRGFAAGRSRPHGCLARRQRRARQCARQWRRRRQGGVRLRARYDPLLRGRRSDPAQRADLSLLARCRPPTRSRESRQAGGEGSE